MAHQDQVQTEALPLSVAIEEHFISAVSAGRYVWLTDEKSPEPYAHWEGSRWFVANVDKRRVAFAIRVWKAENKKAAKLSEPTPAKVARELFDKWAGEAHRKGMIGAFVWVDRIQQGFVEIADEKLLAGKFKVDLMNGWAWKNVPYLNDGELMTLSKIRGVWIEREFEVSRLEVTKAMLGGESHRKLW